MHFELLDNLVRHLCSEKIENNFMVSRSFEPKDSTLKINVPLAFHEMW